jgi:hypothetical protein
MHLRCMFWAREWSLGKRDTRQICMAFFGNVGMDGLLVFGFLLIRSYLLLLRLRRYDS